MSNLSMSPELYKAATEGTDSIKISDSNSIDHQQTTFHEKNNVLHLVSKFDQKDFAEKMIHLHPQLMHQQNHKGDTPLHIASRYGHLRIVELLIKGALEFEPQVIDIEEAPPPPRRNPIFGLLNDKKDTALHDAVRNGHLDVVKFLIYNDLESTKLCNGVGDSPLFLAVDRKFIPISLYITHNAPQCSYRGRDGMNVLHAAVIRTCGVSHTKSLLELWVRHSKHPTAFMYEVLKEIGEIWTHPTEIVKSAWKTLKYKVLRVKKTEENPSHEAIGKRCHEAYSCLGRKKSAIVEEENPCSKLWVNHVMKPTRQVWLKFWSLIPDGRKKSAEENFLRSLIEKFQVLIKEADNELHWTPLHYAAYLRHTIAIKLLLEIDGNVVYEKDKEGMSALHIAAKEGHVEVIKQIIKCFPDTCESLDFRGRTILHVAVENGKYNVVDYILEKKAFRGLVNEQDHGDGNTALHYAAIYGHRIILKMLVDDENVDKGILNNQGIVANTLISDMELRHFLKARITKKLDKTGGPPSLKAIVYKENSATTNVEITKREPENNLTVTDLDPKNSSCGGDQVAKDQRFRKCQDIKEVASTHILVITIIATVTFAAGFQLPGGVEKGHSILSGKLLYAAFQIANTLGFCSSLAAVAIHFSASIEKDCGVYLHFMRFSSALTYMSIWCTGMSYILGTHLVLTHHHLLAAANLAIFGLCFFMAVLLWFFR